MVAQDVQSKPYLQSLLTAKFMFRTPNLQLLSLHVPKTGGTSFRSTLKTIYGEASVARLDVNMRGQVEIDQQAIAPGATILHPVLHGHVKWNQWQELFQASPRTTVITWLRDPVARVTSQYSYLVEVLERELDEPGKGLNILSKLMKTFPEFIRNPEVRNIQSQYFTPIILDRFVDFVGVLEHREADLAKLAQRLSWPDHPTDFQHNKTARLIEPTPSEIDLIRACNDEDVRLYEQVLEWRDAGRYDA